MRYFIFIYGLLLLFGLSCKNSTKTIPKSNNQSDSLSTIFRNINWNMSYKDVKENEKGDLIIDKMDQYGTKNLGISATMLNENVTIVYFFNKDDSIVRGTIIFPVDILSLNMNVEKYESVKKLLIKKYGISDDNTKWYDEYAEKTDSSTFGQNILLGKLKLSCGWYIRSSNTQISLFLNKDEEKGMSLILNYVNVPRFKKEAEEREKENINDL